MSDPDAPTVAAESPRWRLVPLAVSLALLWLLHPQLLLAPTVPASYDLSAHIVPLAEFADRLLPQGRVHGWSDAWFAGFPLFYFYFPLPAFLAAVLSYAVGLPVALKLTSVLGLLAFPFALYSLFRAVHSSRAAAAIGSTVAASFVLMTSFFFLGGNIASALAGEYAFALSFTLSLWYLAAVLRAGRHARDGIGPGVLLAAVALSHLVTTLVVVAITAALLTERRRRLSIPVSWLAGFLLTAFWTVPFLLRHGEMSAVYVGAQRSWSEVVPLELWPILPVAAFGVATLRMRRAALPLLFVMGAGLACYLAAGRLVYPGRFLPYWYLGAHLLAGLGVAQLVPGSGTPAPAPAHRARAWAFLLLALLPLLALNGARGIGQARAWAAVTFSGLERASGGAELEGLAQALEGESGRIYWEQAPYRLASLGSRNLHATLPWFAPDARVLHGLWLESSPLHHELAGIDSAIARAVRDSTAAAPARMRQVVTELGDLGADWFVALTVPTATLLERTGAARITHATPQLALYRLPPAPLIAAADPAAPAVEVLEWTAERVRFRTASPGVPHHVRIAYFPNWRARGAAAPERSEHSLMMVVPQQAEVELVFAATWVERLGTALSLLTVLALLALLLRARRRTARVAP